MPKKPPITAAPVPAPSLFDGERPLPYDSRAALRHLGDADKALARLIERVGPFNLKLRKLESPFDSLAQSIVYQQLSGKAAATILGRVKALFPDSTRVPTRILAMEEAALRGAGLSQGKHRALRDLAQKVIEGHVPSSTELHSMDEEAIVERLTAVRGIGRWTVEMLLIFALGRPDVLPGTDLGVRKGFQIAFRKKELPLPAEVMKRGERWRPYRSVASWYLWRATEL